MSTLSPSATLEDFFKLLKNLYPDFAFKPEDIIQNTGPGVCRKDAAHYGHPKEARLNLSLGSWQT
jgi:hypothetical protein